MTFQHRDQGDIAGEVQDNAPGELPASRKPRQGRSDAAIDFTNQHRSEMHAAESRPAAWAEGLGCTGVRAHVALATYCASNTKSAESGIGLGHYAALRPVLIAMTAGNRPSVSTMR